MRHPPVRIVCLGMNKSVKLLAAASLLVGCYGSAPPRPARIQTPQITADGEVEVFSETTTTMEKVPKEIEHCPSGVSKGHPSCSKSYTDVVEPVTRTVSRASYNGEPITYGQFLVMTDAAYDTKLVELERLSKICKNGNVPRYAGIAFVLGGLIGGAVTKRTEVYYGGLAAGGLSYGIGYFAYGGRQCNEAAAIYRNVDMSVRGGMTDVRGGAAAIEMKTLAEQFNARHRRTGSMMRVRRGEE
jgi:hypothetical protein